MRYILLCLLCFCLTFLSSQVINDFTAATDNHQLIEGTNVYLVPPAGFVVSENFKGFQKPDDQTSMIMLMEIPGPINEVTRGFTKELMATRGMELLRKDSVRIGNLTGFLIEMNQSANGMTFTKTLVVYGNEETSSIVNGISLKDSVQITEQIGQSIKSLFVNEELTINPRDGLSFTLDEKAGDLKFVSVVGNAILLNRTGVIDANDLDQVSLIVDKAFQLVDISDQKEFCLSRLEQYPEPYELHRGKKLASVKLDNLNGYELHAINSENENESIYQLVLFPEGGGYFLFLGDYPTKDKEALQQIKKVIDTFRAK